MHASRRKAERERNSSPRASLRQVGCACGFACFATGKDSRVREREGDRKVTFSEHEEVEWWRDHEEEDGALM
jgi:hypothetical protein